MKKATQAIIFLTTAHILIGIYAFGVFLQYLVIQGQVLTIQAVLEPFFYITLMVIAKIFIFKAVYFQEKLKKQFFDEKKLLPWAVALLMLAAFGTGIHTTGQLIEETFVNSSKAVQHYTDNFSAKVAYFLEEYPGHFFIIIPSFILSFFLAKLELNRRQPDLKKFEKVAILICGLISGTLAAVANAEGSVTIAILPLGVFFLYRLLIINKSLKRDLFSSPFSNYFVVSTTVMAILNIFFGLTNGWFVQPTELGFGSQ
jgi:magnesium-transporting ATPase (P-type)